MLSKWNQIEREAFAALILAILAGVVMGILVFPIKVLASIKFHLGPALSGVVAACAAIGMSEFALRTFRNACAHQRHLDRDLLDAFMEHIPEKVYFKDLNSRFIRISRFMAETYGISSDKPKNITDDSIFTADHSEAALADEKEIVQTGRSIVNKLERETWRDGRETWAVTTKVPLRNHVGQIVGTMGISRDVTEEIQREQRFQNMAMQDSLTGLPNRNLLGDRLSQAIASAKHKGNTLAVLHLDIDHYKNINDRYGYRVGDRILEIIAARLKRMIGPMDTAARFCGDEFVLVYSETNSEEIPSVARKVLRAVEEPIDIDEQHVQITGSVGFALFPADGLNPDDLLKHAGLAVRQAKNKGLSRFARFTSDMAQQAESAQGLEADLYNAHSRGEFLIEYQPIVDARTHKISAMEALLRWKHPKQGIIPPDRFIPLLEEIGMMNEVGSWVLHTACRQMRQWRDLGLPAVRLAVNVSPNQFYEGTIVEAVESALRSSNLDPASLELEITESRVLDDSEVTIGIMRRLKAMGVNLSLDDFGTGWSSLSYLRRFPLDRIKIDRSFTRSIITDPRAKAMVSGIVVLATALNFTTIAEGIETVQQRDLVASLRCSEMQGFLFSRPLTAPEAAALLWKAKAESESRDRVKRTDLHSFAVELSSTLKVWQPQ